MTRPQCPCNLRPGQLSTVALYSAEHLVVKACLLIESHINNIPCSKALESSFGYKNKFLTGQLSVAMRDFHL